MEETPLPSLYSEGMSDEQIWEQLDLRSKRLCEMLDEALEGAGKEEEEDGDENDVGRKGAENTVADGEDEEDEELDRVDWDGAESEDEDGEEDESESEDDDDREDGDLGEDVTHPLRDHLSEEEDLDDEDDPLLSDLLGRGTKKPIKRRKGGHSELDDRFFDLAAFNAEADEAESKSVSKGRLGEDEEDSDDDMSVDLFAPVEDAEEFVDDEQDVEDNGAGMIYDSY